MRRVFRDEYGWLGDYPSWESARRASTGYDTGLILDKVKQASLKVKAGQAAYERDSVLFDRIYYSWPVLAGLLWAASRDGGRLKILDFGGSLGTSYFQNRRFLAQVRDLRWNVVEQSHFVDCGKEHFADERLRFYGDVESCLIEASPDTLLLSSVLQYLESPHQMLDTLIAHKFKTIILNDTPCWIGGNDRITVQKVPPSIYPASYPSWVFGDASLSNHFLTDYELVSDFSNGTIYHNNVTLKGFIFERRSAQRCR